MCGVVVCCLLVDVRGSLFAACCLLLGVFSLFVVCHGLFIAC